MVRHARRLPKTLRDNAFAVRVLGELQNGIFTVFDVTGQNDTLPLCGVGIDNRHHDGLPPCCST